MNLFESMQIDENREKCSKFRTRSLACLNVFVFLWTFLVIIAYWLWQDLYAWDCISKELEENRYCSTTENWIGYLYGYINMLNFIVFVRAIAALIFLIALFRINRLLGKLK